MSHFLKRLEKSIHKLEKTVQKEQMKIDHLESRVTSNKITKADFTIKKKQIEERINALNTRVRVLQGGMTKEKRHEEEKAEEKRKKKEEKNKKKKVEDEKEETPKK
ncbi:MAG: hypothetical protein V1726_04040 [Methanobacteriota archaeon]